MSVLFELCISWEVDKHSEALQKLEEENKQLKERLDKIEEWIIDSPCVCDEGPTVLTKEML